MCALFKLGPERPGSPCTTIFEARCWNWQLTIISRRVLAMYTREIQRADPHVHAAEGGEFSSTPAFFAERSGRMAGDLEAGGSNPLAPANHPPCSH